MRVAVDIDNVVLEWQQTWADLYGDDFNKVIQPEALERWDACLTETHFTSMTEFFEWFNWAGGWVNMPRVPGAMGGLWELQKLNIPFFFCTARPPYGEASAQKLAEQCNTNVVFLSPMSKHLAMARLWVDDSPEVLTNLVKNGKRAIRFDRPWNRNLPKTIERKLHVATCWNDVVEIVVAERAAS